MRFKSIFLLLPLFSFAAGFTQTINDSINQDLIKKTLSYLASDSLAGRVNYSNEQLQAASFINDAFTAYQLQSIAGSSNYLLPFTTNFGSENEKMNLRLNGKNVNRNKFSFITHSLVVTPKKLNDFEILKATIPLADSLLFYNWQMPNRNLLIWVDIPANKRFSKAIKNLQLPPGMPASDILIVASEEEPKELSFNVTGNKMSSTLYNIVGVLPGKSLPGEAIVFSAHYDHVGRGLTRKKEGIYNGANDNASGTTAVLALARYFSMRRDNERTLIFCLFAGEELGLLGSKAFVSRIDPGFIKADINIEMIGKTNRSGRNAFFVTGSNRSDLIEILRGSLDASKVKITNEEADTRHLFERSDNYSFFEKGIAAHSIMCSDDFDPCYHQTCDDISSIDFNHLTRVIQAIAQSCAGLISGAATPSLK